MTYHREEPSRVEEYKEWKRRTDPNEEDGMEV